MTGTSDTQRRNKSLVHCKVCTKKIRAGEDHVKVYHAGAYYIVCCASCASKFEASPKHYSGTT